MGYEAARGRERPFGLPMPSAHVSSRVRWDRRTRFQAIMVFPLGSAPSAVSLGRINRGSGVLRREEEAAAGVGEISEDLPAQGLRLGQIGRIQGGFVKGQQAKGAECVVL